MILSEKEYEERLATTRMNAKSKTSRACKIHLVQGKSMAHAAEVIGITNGVVTRGVKRILSASINKTCICPRCGHEFKG